MTLHRQRRLHGHNLGIRPTAGPDVAQRLGRELRARCPRARVGRQLDPVEDHALIGQKAHGRQVVALGLLLEFDSDVHGATLGGQHMKLNKSLGGRISCLTRSSN